MFVRTPATKRGSEKAKTKKKKKQKDYTKMVQIKQIDERKQITLTYEPNENNKKKQQNNNKNMCREQIVNNVTSYGVLIYLDQSQ